MNTERINEIRQRIKEYEDITVTKILQIDYEGQFYAVYDNKRIAIFEEECPLTDFEFRKCELLYRTSCKCFLLLVLPNKQKGIYNLYNKCWLVKPMPCTTVQKVWQENSTAKIDYDEIYALENEGTNTSLTLVSLQRGSLFQIQGYKSIVQFESAYLIDDKFFDFEGEEFFDLSDYEFVARDNFFTLYKSFNSDNYVFFIDDEYGGIYENCLKERVDNDGQIVLCYEDYDIGFSVKYYVETKKLQFNLFEI